MDVNIQPELAASKALKQTVETATPVLQKMVSEFADEVTASWATHIDDSGRLLLRLTLSGWESEAYADFTPEELQPPEETWWRLSRLWGDLLQIAVRRKLQAVEAALATED